MHRMAAACCILFVLLSTSALAQTEEVSGELKQWHPVTITFSSEMTAEQATPNPFLDYRLDVTFTQGAAVYRVPGYFAADGLAADTSAADGNKWRVHFTPDKMGTWAYSVAFRTGPNIAVSDDPTAGQPLDFDGVEGTFTVGPSDKTGRDFKGKGFLRYVGKHYLQFAGSQEYLVKGGASGPENLLAYVGFDQTTPSHTFESHGRDWHEGDRSWRGMVGRDIVGAVNYLAERGLNAINIVTLNVGSAGHDVWPWTSPDTRDRFDCSKLDQWDILFAQMDQIGLVLQLSLQASGSNALLDGGELGLHRKLYCREMIARFAHHLGLVWDIGLSEPGFDVQRKAFAAYLRAHDPYQHAIVGQTPSGQEATVSSLLGAPYFEGASLVTDLTTAKTDVAHYVEASTAASRPWVASVDGFSTGSTAVTADGVANNHDAIRKNVLWPTLLAGGAGCGWSFGTENVAVDDLRTREGMWDYTRYALKFFHAYLPFYDMTPQDNLVKAGNAACLAKPGEAYALYLAQGQPVTVDLGAASQSYSLYWYDPRHGGPLKLAGAVSGPGLRSLPAPPSQDDWVALLIPPQAAADITTINIQSETLLSSVKRLGINVPACDTSGAGQIFKDLIKNPGFEPGLYGMVFHADEGATGTQIPQAFWDPTWNSDADGIGQPDGFWNNARYEILSGPAKGRIGKVTRFAPVGSSNIFYLDANGAVPEPYDAIAVQTAAPGFDVKWAAPNQARPGSPGTQSLHLTYKEPAWEGAYCFYFDTGVYSSAEKFYIVKGRWHIELWAKGKKGGETLSAVFMRHGEVTFYEGIYTLSTQWQKFEADFDVAEGMDKAKTYYEGEHPALFLSFYVNNPGEEAWVDDISLRRRDYTNPTIFSDPFVNRLKELRPGILRNWTVQLGDTLDNQLAPPFARKPHGFQPHFRCAELYDCSFHEFLQLCKEVGADPWYVIPPTFTKDELANLMAYLALPVDSGHPYALKRAELGQVAPWTGCFRTINLEFGNELWGAACGTDPFFGSSLLGGTRMAEIAHERLDVLKKAPGYVAAKFNLVLGGQYGWPPVQTEIEQNSSNHNTVAIAPYFGEILDVFGTDWERYYPLFARARYDVANGSMKKSRDALMAGGNGTALGVYEINFHTTYGEVPVGIRNDFVSGAAGALAMPLYTLTYMRDLGARDQCAFTAAQFDFRIETGESVRLWGLLRDIESTARKRPTWLGAELANRAIRGDMVDVDIGGDNPCLTIPAINGVEEKTELALIQAFAFRDAKSYGLIIFNLDIENEHKVQINASQPLAYETVLYQVAPQSIHDNNENENNVNISAQPLPGFALPHTLTLPRHSVSALTWEFTVRDSDGDGHLDTEDAFPHNATEWTDADNDGLGDNIENAIIERARTDDDPTNNGIVTLADVLPEDDFDADGSTNLQEFEMGSDPLDPAVSVPVTLAFALICACVIAAMAVFRLRARAR